MKALAPLLGFVTFVVAYLWVFTYPLIANWLERRANYAPEGRERRQRIAFALMIAGGVALWLTWEYVLPDWWRNSTLVVSYE